MTSQIRFLFLSCVLTFLLNPILFLGQSDYSYILRDGTRYEGIITVNTASPDLELKSFMIGNLNETIDKGDKLRIHFYNPGLRKIYIRVNEIIPLENYQMDPIKYNWKDGWNTFSNWPVNSVLIPKEINIFNIGGLGSTDKKFIDNSFIIPIQISKSDIGIITNVYKVKLLSRETISYLTYQVIRVRDGKVVEDEIIDKDFNAGTPILITLNSQNYLEGEYKLKVSAKIKNENGGPNRSYLFFHKKINKQ